MSNGSDADIPLRHSTSRTSRAIKTGYQRFERPVYDYARKYAPCQAACPAGHDLPWALYLAGRGRLDLALRTLKEESPFPAITGRVCYHPCERGCNRAEYDQGVAINALERALAEYGNGHPDEAVPRLHEESVGVIGAGPAGLTCAYHLVRMGYPVTVYDANDRPGGLLAYGIPAYRLPRRVMVAESASLHALGVAFRMGVRIGVDLSFEEVRRSHHALFLAPGLARPRALPIPVPKDPRIESGLGFLRSVATGTAQPLSGHVVVIGGGDVAVDAARCALRLGAEKVTLCCVESRSEMPAHPQEIAAARQERVEVANGVAPVEIRAEGIGVVVTLARVTGVRRSADGGVLVSTDEGPARTLTAARLITAIGQEADLSFLAATSKRALRVDAWGRTGLRGIFAGGDVTGSYNVVNAIASAKRAVIGIDSYLRGLNLEGIEEQVRVGQEGALSLAAYRSLRAGSPRPPAENGVRLRDINLDYFPPADRVQTPEVDPGLRVGSFAEANPPLGQEDAIAEAQRCFHCGTCDMCGNCFTFCPDSSVFQLEEWGFAIDLDHCKGCGVCVEECPRHAMSMVPEWEVAREVSAR